MEKDICGLVPDGYSARDKEFEAFLAAESLEMALILVDYQKGPSIQDLLACSFLVESIEADCDRGIIFEDDSVGLSSKESKSAHFDGEKGFEGW